MQLFFLQLFSLPLTLSVLRIVPEIINGRTHTTTVVDLNPWVEYEFRVVAGNSIGIGEPSTPSELLRTKASSKHSQNCVDQFTNIFNVTLFSLFLDKKVSVV